jgi:N-acetylglucosaminyldiphosphoundecaprenol N-acetyl-beta-D-mannosaminyltransferase
MSDTTKILGFNIYNNQLRNIDFKNSRVINTINPHSYVVSLKDADFHQALQSSDVLLPDGIGIVWAAKFLKKVKIQRIAGYDLFIHLLGVLNEESGSCFFLGASEKTLEKIVNRLKIEYPNINVGSFSPPFKDAFSNEDSRSMIQVVNEFSPKVLFVGMTAPKQEKWVHQFKGQLDSNIICSIGAVFDFYALNVPRAPNWLIKIGLEWLHRIYTNPIRLGKRSLESIPKFIINVFLEKLKL